MSYVNYIEREEKRNIAICNEHRAKHNLSNTELTEDCVNEPCNVDCPFNKLKPIKETDEAYYYNFPKELLYIIRWLKSGGYHLYPSKDGELPQGFKTIEDAQKFIDGWKMNAMIVTHSEASKYPVPKRW